MNSSKQRRESIENHYIGMEKNNRSLTDETETERQLTSSRAGRGQLGETNLLCDLRARGVCISTISYIYRQNPNKS